MRMYTDARTHVLASCHTPLNPQGSRAGPAVQQLSRQPVTSSSAHSSWLMTASSGRQTLMRTAMLGSAARARARIPRLAAPSRSASGMLRDSIASQSSIASQHVQYTTMNHRCSAALSASIGAEQQALRDQPEVPCTRRCRTVAGRTGAQLLIARMTRACPSRRS